MDHVVESPVKGPPRKEIRNVVSSSSSQSSQSNSNSSDDDVLIWKPEDYPKVQKIVSLTCVPEFRMEFTTKRSGPGNHTIVHCHLDKQSLFDFDRMDQVLTSPLSFVMEWL